MKKDLSWAPHLHKVLSNPLYLKSVENMPEHLFLIVVDTPDGQNAYTGRFKSLLEAMQDGFNRYGINPVHVFQARRPTLSCVK